MCPQAFKHILEKKTEKTPPLPSVSSILLPRAFVFSQVDAQAHCLGKQVQVPPVQPSETHALTAVACFALDTLTDTMQGRTSHTVAHTHSPHLLTLLGLSGRLISEECFHQ